MICLQKPLKQKDLGYEKFSSKSMVESLGYVSTADLVRSILSTGSSLATSAPDSMLMYDEKDGSPVDPSHPDEITPTYSDKIEILQAVKNGRERVRQDLASIAQKQAAMKSESPTPSSDTPDPQKSSGNADNSKSETK